MKREFSKTGITTKAIQTFPYVATKHLHDNVKVSVIVGLL
jgi:hypothetical protein